jgi:hypothetical protein
VQSHWWPVARSNYVWVSGSLYVLESLQVRLFLHVVNIDAETMREKETVARWLCLLPTTLEHGSSFLISNLFEAA